MKEHEMAYDGGLSEPIYEDVALEAKPKRKRTPSAKKDPSEFTPEADAVVEALANGENVEGDLFGLFEQYSPKTGLVCDTTGMIGRLCKDEAKKEKEMCEEMSDVSDEEIIMKWCEKMKGKEKADFTDDEIDALDAIRELLHNMD